MSVRERADPLDYRGPKVQTPRRVLALVVVAIAVIGFVVYQHRAHRHVDQSASIGSAIGADACSDSGYWISQTAGKLEVYNCDMPSGKTICVTDSSGVASNSTILVRIAFADALSGKPACLG